MISKYSSPIKVLTLATLIIVTMLVGCTSVPENVTPVNDFKLERYLGTWYEIARLDHSFERGLDGVQAEYKLRDDGGITVFNKGYSTAEQKWVGAEGKAYFVSEPTIGHLKVSFFGPFYSSYVVFELDKDDYQYAFVSGYNSNYLWLLARTPTVSDELVARFKQVASTKGFNVDELIFPNHSIAKD